MNIAFVSVGAVIVTAKSMSYWTIKILIDMCKCVNIEMGSYNNQELLDVPAFMYPIRNCLGEVKSIQKIGIDRCLVPTIKFLWSNKIATLNCCCGHNKHKPTIIIEEKYIPKLMKLGYSHFSHNDSLLDVYIEL